MNANPSPARIARDQRIIAQQNTADLVALVDDPEPGLAEHIAAAARAELERRTGDHRTPAPTPYTPRPLTISRSTVDADRYRLAYMETRNEPASSHDLVRWHDAVLAIEFQRPSWSTEPGSAPHPAAVEILADVRHHERTGVFAVTIDAETRPALVIDEV
jgi:hypothetical protein